ncbi:MAG: deoxynucleoside kinase [Burkholderiaceae bacterium]|nr:MAG: deoxynucleoside kinase [Burkholderiaceae bacterium]
MNLDTWIRKYKNIVVEGPIGVGKTSLTKKIADKYQLRTVLENAEENPFLRKFYADNEKYALPTQLFFLFQRLDQLIELSQTDLFETNLISDFMLEKDTIFAGITLNELEMSLYRKIYENQSSQVCNPDLVIYLQADPGTLLDRIKKRGILMERDISIEYIVNLSNAYNKFFYTYEESPVLIVNTTHLDPIHKSEDFDLLMNQLKMFKGRRAFFNAI